MLMQEIGFGSNRPAAIFCDNKGAIMIRLHPSTSPSTGHNSCVGNKFSLIASESTQYSAF